MSRKYQAFPGMQDILPGEVEKWQWIEEKARIFFETRGFQEIRTPLLEPTELFARSIGEASDIVHKEMYTFEDRGGRSMTLRPEMTASVARAVIENGLLKTSKSLRLYYIGPMFRAERPQAGRKRQFHQIGVEMINHAGNHADLELMTSLCDFLNYLSVKNSKFKINDLGQRENRGKMIEGLTGYFTEHRSQLCEDCRWRLEKNVLRIFDCKVESCQPVIQKAPWEEIAPISEDFENITSTLRHCGIPFEVHRRLVRGLDYYNGMVFEVAAEGLGAQDAIAGGGRYDNLYEELGGGNIPCTGFSLGVERLVMSLEKSVPPIGESISREKVYFAPITEGLEPESQKALLNLIGDAATGLCEWGMKAIQGDCSLKLSDHLKKANKIGAKFVVITGSKEMQAGIWAVKNMTEQKQEMVRKGELLFHLKGKPPV